LIREVNAIIKSLQINQALDAQDEIDREYKFYVNIYRDVFLMGLKDSNLASNAGGDSLNLAPNISSAVATF
jgi:hypothetical protein